MNATDTSSLLLIPLLIGVVLLHVGAYFVRLGWFPRRAGTTPHCRRCGYSLEGLQTDRCPECGNYLTPRTIVKGRRVRRTPVGVLGLFVTLAGIGLAVVAFSPGLRNIDWDAHKPLFWVLNDLESTDTAARDRAWPELTRRFAAGALTDADKRKLDAAVIRLIARSAGTDAMRDHVVARYSQLDDAQKNIVFANLLADLQGNSYVSVVSAEMRLMDLITHDSLTPAQLDRLEQFALASQAAKTRVLANDWLLNFLGDRAVAGRLSPARRDQFFGQGMPPSLNVRPEMIAGRQLPFWVSYDGQGPENGWWSREELVAIALDDDPPTPHSTSGTGGGFTRSASGSSIPVAKAGKHVVHVTIRTSAFTGVYPSPDANPTPFWTRTLTLSAPFVALPADTRDDITLIDDPSLADAIRRSINVKDVRASQNNYDRVSMTVAIKSPPVNVAFDVFARQNGKESRIGSVYSNAGEEHNFGVGSHDFTPAADAKTIDVVLRASPDVARGTIDLYEIWNGELTYPGVAVQARP